MNQSFPLLRQAICEKVQDGQRIGVGTGRTVAAALAGLLDATRERKLRIECLATSWVTAWQLGELGLPVVYSGYTGELDWGFDGADEIDPQGRLIKGGGGALLQEKIMARRCREYLVIADPDKQVQVLGSRCPVPVEILPEAKFDVERRLRQLGAWEIVARGLEPDARPRLVFTEKGNIILDVRFHAISDDLDITLKAIPGVVESGLFFRFTDEILIEDGKQLIRQRMVKAQQA